MHFGYATTQAMNEAIAKETKIGKKGVSVVEHLLAKGKGEMFLNGLRVRTFHTKEMGYYFLCD